MDNKDCVRIPTSDGGSVYALGPNTGYLIKKDLAAQAPEERAKGDKNDAAFKQYQDRMDIVCMCSIQMNQELNKGLGFKYNGWMGDKGDFVGKTEEGEIFGTNNPLYPGEMCPTYDKVSGLNATDPAYKKVVSSAINKYNVCINVPGVNNYHCDPEPTVDNALGCVESVPNSLYTMYACPPGGLIR